MVDRLANWSPHRYRESYKAKLVTIGVVITLIAAGVSGVFVSRTGASLADAREHQLTDEARSQSEMAQQWLQGLRNQVALLSQAETLRNGEPHHQSEYLESHESRVGENVAGLHVLDPDDGTVVASSLGYAEGKAVASPELTRVAANVSHHDAAPITRPFTTDLAGDNESDRRTVVAVVSPIPRREDQVVALLVDLEDASEVLSAPRDGNAHLLMRDGTVLLSTDHGLIGQDAVRRGLIPNETLRTVRNSSEFSTYNASTDGHDDHDETTTTDGHDDHDETTTTDGHNETTARIARGGSLSLYSGGSGGSARVATPGNGSGEGGHHGNDTTATQFDGSATVEGQPAMQATAPVSGQGAVVTISQPRSSALAVKNQVMTYMGGLSAILLIAGLGLFAFTVGRTTMRDLRQLSEDALAVSEGELDREITSDRDDEFGDVFESVDAMRADIKAQIDELEELTDELEERNEQLTAAVERHSAVMARCADGDLTARMDTDSGVDQIDDLAREFNGMVAEIETMAVELKRFADEVATNAEEVTASTEEVEAASNSVTTSIQRISEGTDRQYENLQEITDEMETLSTTTEEIASQANEASRLAADTAEVGRESRDDARRAVAGMETVQASTERTVAQMETLASRMDEIDRLAESIKSIADDTNRIALNANIEASRAGEDATGEGFGAVAEEIRELADDAGDSAEEIDRIVEEVADQAGSTVESVRETGDQVAEQTEAVERTVDALEEIADYAERTESAVQEISAATEEQASSAQEIVAMTDEVTEISESNSEEAASVASAAEEQTSALSEVANSASSLSEEANDLATQMNRFDTGEEPGDVSVPAEVEGTDD